MFNDLINKFKLSDLFVRPQICIWRAIFGPKVLIKANKIEVVCLWAVCCPLRLIATVVLRMCFTHGYVISEFENSERCVFIGLKSFY
jgi:hypothetical protein